MRVPDLEQADDTELVELYVKGGDTDALEVLLKRHESRVYGLSLRMLGNRQDALDATQEVFITVFRKAQSFKGHSAFTTWLYRLTINACHDLGRRKKRTPTPVEEVVAASPDGVARVDEKIAIQAAMSSLPRDQAAVVLLRDMYQMSYEEIADIVGVPTGTVKSRIARGRMALTTVLSPEEPVAAPNRLNET